MKRILTFLIILILSLAFVPSTKGSGAFLYLTPSEGKFGVGEEFSVSVKVDTGGLPINAVRTILYFPSDKLSVVEISKEESILSLWTEEPVFSNADGIVSFSGGLPHPGFTGRRGHLISVKFRAKEAGNISFNFGESAILASDGKGTDLFAYGESPTYTIEALAPVIFSSTYPEEDKWYPKNNPEFHWNLSSSVVDVSFSLNKNPESLPDTISEGRLGSQSYEGLEDGIWYFHLRTKDDSGWSLPRHFTVHIDTSSPYSFGIAIDNNGDSTNPRPRLYFEANDDASGISYYRIKIGDGEPTTVLDPSPYQVPHQAPGVHPVTIEAFDLAGNSQKSTAEMLVQSIEEPTVTIWPRIYVAGEEIFYTEGISLPNTEVMLFLERNGKVIKEWQAPPSDEEKWSFSASDLMKSGIYYLFARAKDGRGAISNPSGPYKVEVLFSGIALGPILITFRNLALTLASVLIIVIVIAIFFAGRGLKAKKILKKETQEVKESLHKGFDELRKDIIKEIERLEGVKSKRELDEKEKEIIKNLREDLKEVERHVGKEIKDVERELG